MWDGEEGSERGSGLFLRDPRPPTLSPSHPSLVGTPSAMSPLPRPHQRSGPVTASDHLEGEPCLQTAPLGRAQRHPILTQSCVFSSSFEFCFPQLSPISKYYICTEMFISPYIIICTPAPVRIFLTRTFCRSLHCRIAEAPHSFKPLKASPKVVYTWPPNFC